MLLQEVKDFEIMLSEVKNFEKLAKVIQQINIQKHRENLCLKNFEMLLAEEKFFKKLLAEEKNFEKLLAEEKNNKSTSRSSE